jgi:hypothetical protein
LLQLLEERLILCHKDSSKVLQRVDVRTANALAAGSHGVTGPKICTGICAASTSIATSRC